MNRSKIGIEIKLNQPLPFMRKAQFEIVVANRKKFEHQTLFLRYNAALDG